MCIVFSAVRSLSINHNYFHCVDIPGKARLTGAPAQITVCECMRGVLRVLEYRYCHTEIRYIRYTISVLTINVGSLSDIHNVRPHKGQISVARRFRSVLHSETYPSQISGQSSVLFYDNLDAIPNLYTWLNSLHSDWQCVCSMQFLLILLLTLPIF